MKHRGFTLIELVVVITVTGILFAVIGLNIKPAFDSYVDSRRRAELTDMADTALRRMTKDIRAAVPNSIQSYSASCFQLVPTIGGGRYRMASDTVNDSGTLPCTPSATCSAPLDASQATTVFDVLSPLATLPSANDWVVIDNQNTSDVYNGGNRGQISAIQSAPTLPRTSDGLYRITIASTAFPAGYDGGRFALVANAEQTVFYSCIGGKLYRTTAAFGATATTCNATSGDIVATDVTGCSFVYDPNQGATQQSGFLWMRLVLGSGGESVVLSHGAHVDNVP
ncbi:hypothetical protein DLREEDagrD3_25960 [Denitratisoma sp. agr-D3]